jgi:hypothetical protein
MATTAKTIVPESQPKGRKALSKAHKAKLAAALAEWRASLTEEDRAALRERNAAAHKERWNNMSERERKDRLAGVKAWQRQQKAAKRAAAKAAPKAAPKARAAKGSSAASGGERLVHKRTVKPLPDLQLDVLEQPRKRTRKGEAQ